MTFAEAPPTVFYNVKRITPRTKTLTKAQREINPRRGVVLYIDSRPPVNRVKRVGKRATTAAAQAAKAKPISLYQQN